MNWLHANDGLGDDWSAINDYQEEINKDLTGVVEVAPRVEEKIVLSFEPEENLVAPPDEAEQLISRAQQGSLKFSRNELIVHFIESNSKIEGHVGWPSRLPKVAGTAEKN